MLRSQLLKGTTPLLILSVLADEELYGYEIAQRIRQRSGSTLDPRDGSLYPALHSLEASGALEANWRAGQRGPRRRYYRLTRKGRQLLKTAQREWDAVSKGIERVAATATRGAGGA